MPKVDYADLESVTKFLDELSNPKKIYTIFKARKNALKLSKMIKDKYTEIKPDYEQ